MSAKINQKRPKKPRATAYGKIKGALEDNRYKYRTLKGVARSAGVSVEQVSKELDRHPEEIVIISRKNQLGESLYTTRRHYRKKASVSEKMMGAFINRVY